MNSIPVLPAVAGAVVLLFLVLVLKLRGSRGRDDLMGPRKRGRKRITPGDASPLIELVSAGDEEGTLRMIREAGYEEAEARKILARRQSRGLWEARTGGMVSSAPWGRESSSIRYCVV